MNENLTLAIDNVGSEFVIYTENLLLTGVLIEITLFNENIYWVLSNFTVNDEVKSPNNPDATIYISFNKITCFYLKEKKQ